MNRAIAIVIALGACGRVGFSTSEIASDGGSDAAPCQLVDWTHASVTFTPLTSLNANDIDDWEPTVSPDELTIVFGTYRGASESELYIATRTAIDEEFLPPAAIPGFGVDASEDVFGPAWSLDGSRLYYSHGAETMVVSYANGVFGVPEPSGLPDDNPVFVSDTEVFVTNNDLFNDYDLVHYRFDGAEWIEKPIPVLYNRVGNGQSDGWPAYDRTTGDVYFEHADGLDATLARARLSSGELPSMFELLTALGADLGDPDISRDGRRMYVGSRRREGTDNDIYMFERGCQ